MSSDPGPREIAAFVRARALGVVATINSSGAPEAALVGLAAMDDGTLVFDAPVTSRKVANIMAEPRVAVVVGCADVVSVQIEGRAAVTTGSTRRRLATSYLEQLPGSRALDKGFAVVAVVPNWVRVYDTSTDPALVREVRWS